LLRYGERLPLTRFATMTLPAPCRLPARGATAGAASERQRRCFSARQTPPPRDVMLTRLRALLLTLLAADHGVAPLRCRLYVQLRPASCRAVV